MGSWGKEIGNIAGPILGAGASKKGAKQAGNQAASTQQDLLNQYLARYHQQQVMQRAGIDALAGQNNPFQQAAQASSPFFSAPGQDVSTFGPGSLSGTGANPDPNAYFVKPMGPMQAPAPAQNIPSPSNGWGGGMNRFFNLAGTRQQ